MEQKQNNSIEAQAIIEREKGRLIFNYIETIFDAQDRAQHVEQERSGNDLATPNLRAWEWHISRNTPSVRSAEDAISNLIDDEMLDRLRSQISDLFDRALVKSKYVSCDGDDRDQYARDWVTKILKRWRSLIRTKYCLDRAVGFYLQCYMKREAKRLLRDIDAHSSKRVSMLGKKININGEHMPTFLIALYAKRFPDTEYVNYKVIVDEWPILTVRYPNPRMTEIKPLHLYLCQLESQGRNTAEDLKIILKSMCS